jgi:hypothetical protein
VHALLIASGRAVWLGQPFHKSMPPAIDDLARSTSRVRSLLNSATSGARSSAMPAAGPLPAPLSETGQSSQGLA